MLNCIKFLWYTWSYTQKSPYPNIKHIHHKTQLNHHLDDGDFTTSYKTPNYNHLQRNTQNRYTYPHIPEQYKAADITQHAITPSINNWICSHHILNIWHQYPLQNVYDHLHVTNMHMHSMPQNLNTSAATALRPTQHHQLLTQDAPP